MAVRSVLGVFSQPKGTDPLRLQTEQRAITQCLQLGKYRDSVCFDVLCAATINDLRRALLSRTYDVVHFSGHGDYDAPLIRWCVAQAAELGVGRQLLSQQRVRQEAKAAKARVLAAESAEIALASLLEAGAEPPDTAVDQSIRLTAGRLEQLGAGALALEDEKGDLSPPNPTALAELLCSAGVRAVVLNACETHYQARLLQQHGVPFVVASPALLSDQCGVEFARGFYDFLFNTAAAGAAEGAAAGAIAAAAAVASAAPGEAEAPPSLFYAAHQHGLLAVRLRGLEPSRHGTLELLVGSPAPTGHGASHSSASGSPQHEPHAAAHAAAANAAAAADADAAGGKAAVPSHSPPLSPPPPPATRRRPTADNAADAAAGRDVAGAAGTAGASGLDSDAQALGAAGGAPAQPLDLSEAQTRLGLAKVQLELGEVAAAAAHLAHATPALDAWRATHADAVTRPAVELHEWRRAFAEAKLLTARLRLQTGDIFEARGAVGEALPLFELLRDGGGIAAALKVRGNVLGHMGHLEQALGDLEAALPLFLEQADLPQQASTLRSLGELHMQWAATLARRHDPSAARHQRQAAAELERALPLYRHCREPKGEANTLRSLGQLHMEMGRLSEAKVYMERALPLFRTVNQRLEEKAALEGKARLKLMQLLGEEIGEDPQLGAQFRWKLGTAEAAPLVPHGARRRRQASLLARLLGVLLGACGGGPPAGEAGPSEPTPPRTPPAANGADAAQPRAHVAPAQPPAAATASEPPSALTNYLRARGGAGAGAPHQGVGAASEGPS